nr:MAG TPA: hypothetical protein [Caudoviricetes sp.]
MRFFCIQYYCTPSFRFKGHQKGGYLTESIRRFFDFMSMIRITIIKLKFLN